MIAKPPVSKMRAKTTANLRKIKNIKSASNLTRMKIIRSNGVDTHLTLISHAAAPLLS